MYQVSPKVFRPTASFRTVPWRRSRVYRSRPGTRHPILAVFSLASAVLLAVGNAGAALLFQDRHASANGEETVYRFEANAISTTLMIDQPKAVKVGKIWVTEYYGIGNLKIAAAQERSMPFHFWLIALSAPGQSKNGTYYSIVLPDGSVVEPKIFRQNLTAGANPVDFTKDTELAAPVKNLEIHGEVVFTYGFGKGLRSCGPFVHNPAGIVWPDP
jgi:hypothetical protein